MLLRGHGHQYDRTHLIRTAIMPRTHTPRSLLLSRATAQLVPPLPSLVVSIRLLTAPPHSSYLISFSNFPRLVAGITYSDDVLALMTPGILTTMIIFGGAYAFYTYENYLIAKNGRGIIHGWLTDKVADGWDPEEYHAAIEDARQRTKQHYELSQRPIVRTIYPEYGPPSLSLDGSVPG